MLRAIRGFFGNLISSFMMVINLQVKGESTFEWPFMCGGGPPLPHGGLVFRDLFRPEDLGGIFTSISADR